MKSKVILSFKDFNKLFKLLSEYYILVNYRIISVNSILRLTSDEIYQKRNIKSGINKVMKYCNPIKINITFPHQVVK